MDGSRGRRFPARKSPHEPMQLTNSLTRRKEEIPPPPGPSRMYACRPTVYQQIQVGNARPYVVSLWLRRWLSEPAYDVTLVENVTDVNDKIYDAARAPESAASSSPPARTQSTSRRRWATRRSASRSPLQPPLPGRKPGRTREPRRAHDAIYAPARERAEDHAERKSSCYQGTPRTGATGLEPATSGVTGHYEGRDG